MTSHRGMIEAIIPTDRFTAQMTDRERDGLRGPVKTCIEESIYPELKMGDQIARGEVRNYTTREFAPDGRLLTTRTQSGGSEWITTKTYDARGRLVRIAISKVGEPGKDDELSSETLFTYDEGGRLLSITQKGSRVDFEYDGDRRKSATQTFDLETIRRGQKTLVMGSRWHAAVGGIGVAPERKLITIYDEKGQASESQVLTSGGEMVCRFVGTYDEDGRVLEEQTFLEQPVQLLLEYMAAARKVSFTPEQVEQVKEQLKKINAKIHDKPHVTQYTYDARGRQTKIRRCQGMLGETTISMAYNDQGEQIEWQQEVTFNPNMRPGTRYTLDKKGELVATEPASESVRQPFPADPYVVCSDYQYDNWGNWTQKISSHPMHPDEPSTVVNRKLAYY